ncbi:MAG: hypothetical protein ABL909_02240 [Sphingopyxis sp.]
MLDHDELIASDAGVAISDGARARRRHGQGICSRVDYDKIIAQSVHFYEVSAHARGCSGAMLACPHPLMPQALSHKRMPSAKKAEFRVISSEMEHFTTRKITEKQRKSESVSIQSK